MNSLPPSAFNTFFEIPTGLGKTAGVGAKEPGVAEPAAGYRSAPPLTAAEKKMAEAIAAEGLAIQDRFRPEPLYKQTGKGNYESQTVEDIRKAKQQRRDRP